VSKEELGPAEFQCFVKFLLPAFHPDKQGAGGENLSCCAYLTSQVQSPR
jgi:hypothetical protein